MEKARLLVRHSFGIEPPVNARCVAGRSMHRDYKRKSAPLAKCDVAQASLSFSADDGAAFDSAGDAAAEGGEAGVSCSPESFKSPRRLDKGS